MKTHDQLTASENIGQLLWLNELLCDHICEKYDESFTHTFSGCPRVTLPMVRDSIYGMLFGVSEAYEKTTEEILDDAFGLIARKTVEQ